MLFAWEEENVRECTSLLHNFVLQVNVVDMWQRLLDPLVVILSAELTISLHLPKNQLIGA